MKESWNTSAGRRTASQKKDIQLRSSKGGREVEKSIQAGTYQLCYWIGIVWEKLDDRLTPCSLVIVRWHGGHDDGRVKFSQYLID